MRQRDIQKFNEEDEIFITNFYRKLKIDILISTYLFEYRMDFINLCNPNKNISEHCIEINRVVDPPSILLHTKTLICF